MSGGGFFGGLFGGGGSGFEERDEVVAQLTRDEGWDMKMVIGSDEARRLGGTGAVAKGDSMSVGIGLTLRMILDEGYDPPQGTMLVAGSKVFKGEDGGEMRGFWQVSDVQGEEVPNTLSLSFRCPDGVEISGDAVIPPGYMYASVDVGRDGRGEVKLCDGRLTVKEDVKTAFLLTAYNSILAEYKLVGTCEARPHMEGGGAFG